MRRRDRDRHVEILIGQSGAPRIHRELRWENLAAKCEAEAAMHAALRAASERAGRGGQPCITALIAPGNSTNNGTGKTFSTSIAVVETCRLGMNARWTLMIDMLDDLRREYTADGDILRKIGEYASPQLLVIDDIDKARATQDEWLLLFRVLDKRTWDHGKETVIVTNLSETELASRVGNSIADRITKIVVCDWPSYRQRSR